MLEDRSYMRNELPPTRWSMTVVVLVVNLAVFVLQEIHRWHLKQPLDFYIEHNIFTLSVEGLRHGFVWQLITFQFMHGGWIHLLLNSVAIYCFGRAIEETLGSKTFLKIYISSGVIGGLIQILVAVLVPHRYGSAVVGASAGGAGLIAAFATLFPERPLTVLLFFLIPVEMKAKILLLLIGGFAIYGITFPGGPIAHAAHLGGMLSAIAYVRWIVLPRSGSAFTQWPDSTKAHSH